MANRTLNMVNITKMEKSEYAVTPLKLNEMRIPEHIRSTFRVYNQC